MDEASRQAGIHEGDAVRIAEDDWGLVGHRLVLVDLEPVPGSSQCVVDDCGERITVSRASLLPV